MGGAAMSDVLMCNASTCDAENLAARPSATAAERMAARPLLALGGVDFAFEEGHRKILRDVDLAFAAGERVLLLGPSGGGKSTLLMLLAGLIPRIVGGVVTCAVRLGGIDTHRVETSLAAFSTKVAIVMQDPESQITCLTVADEIAFALENFGLPQKDIIARTEEALTRCGMAGMRDTLVYTLSGGQKQRLAIACALARRPEILILDEPLSNLDPAGCAEVMPLIVETACREGSALVMTAHDFAAFADLFTRVVIIAEGCILRDGPIRDVLCDVALLRELGLEVPLYLQWAAAMLGPAMVSAPLSLPEALAMVTNAGIRPALPDAFRLARPDPPAAAGVLVDVRALEVAFGRHTVLRGLDFSIDRHDILALVGFNGSGKSTLALTLAGAIAPRSGRITVAGTPYRYRRGRQIGRSAAPIGYVFQYPEHQFLHETIVAELRHGRPDLGDEEAGRILGAIGIGDPAGHPYELSGGEKRRLGVRATMLLAPELLILDEPTYGQDEKNRSLIEGDLLSLHRAGTTIVVITHDMDLIYRLATRVMVLRRGEITMDSSHAEFFGGDVDLAALGLAEPPLRTLHRAMAAG